MNEQEVHVCSLVLGAWLKKKFGTSTIYSRIGLRVSWDFWFQAGCPKSQLWDLRTWWNHARNVSELTDETNVKFWNLNYFVFAKCFTYLNEEMQSSKVVIVKSVHIITFGRKFLIISHRFESLAFCQKFWWYFSSILNNDGFVSSQFLKRNRIGISVFWNQIFEWATRIRITFL